MRRLILLTCSLLLICLALPAVAAADTEYYVNSALDTGDFVNDGTCETATGNGVCTLRAALAEAGDVVGQVFVLIDSSVAPTINVSSMLSVPANTTVDGCYDVVDPTAPCATIAGSFTGAAIRLMGDGSRIENLAIVMDDSASSGVVIEGSNAIVSSTWVGMRADGSTIVQMAAGVIVRGNGAQVGTLSGPFRTTLVNVDTGVEVLGVDNVAIRGTNIGLNAAGQPAAQGVHATSGGQRGIQVAKEGANVPNNITIGGTLNAQEAATTACDGPCNAIGRMSVAGIDLDDPDGSPESVYVRANYLGLGANGTTDASIASTVGIEVGETQSLSIGGGASDLRTVIAGGQYAVRQQSASGTVNVDGGYFGMDATGTTAIPAALAAIDLAGDWSGIGSSRITAHPTTGTGVILRGNDTSLASNVVGLGVNGESMPMQRAVRILGNDAAIGYGTSNANRICGSTSGPAITIEGGDRAAIHGNTIGIDEQGLACTGARRSHSGIAVRQVGANAPQDTIVGSTGSSMNTISNVEGNAVTFATTGGGNSASHNVGSGNGGLMLDIGSFADNLLDGDGPGNPDGDNGGFAAPAITSATTLAISGTGSEPGARIYVWATSSPAGAPPNGVQTLLGSTQVLANGSNTWTFEASPSLANDTKVTVTQRREPANESTEFSNVTAVLDRTVPDTTITAGSTGTVAAATFSFAAPGETGATFECRLDAGAFAACTSPFAVAGAGDGAHSFEVRTIDAAGNADPSPATRSFTLDTTGAVARITTAPPARTRARTVKTAFDASGETGATFQCAVDAGAFSACTSPFTTPQLAPGAHTIRVRATDALGNRGADAAAAVFVDVDAPRLTLVGRSLRPSKTGVLRVRVSCAAGESSGPCTGRLTLASAARIGIGRRARIVTFGSAKLRVTAGRTATVTIRLSAANLELLTSLGTVATTARIVAADIVGNSRTTTRRLPLLAPLG